MGAYWSRMAVCTPVAGPPTYCMQCRAPEKIITWHSKVCRISSFLGAL